MLKKLIMTSTRIPKKIIVGLLIVGVAYLLWPKATPSAATPALTATAPASVVARPVAQKSATPENRPAATATATPTPTATPLRFTPGPVNQATADYQTALATAEALINGSDAAAPPLANAARPTTVDWSELVIVTQTPTPQNIITVAAQAAGGTSTPLPVNWVVPEIITPPPPTPIPANAATATFQVAAATAVAVVYGTPTPAPPYVWTATPTPFMQPVVGQVATPWLPPTPTSTPQPIPAELVGKIVFLSNRSGGPQPLDQPLVYAIDPDGSHLTVLADDTFYQTALARDVYSADQRYRTFVRTIDGTPAIFTYDAQTQGISPVTFFPAGQGAWDPVLSPDQSRVAFVSNAEGDDEIWVANRDGSGLKRLTALNAAYNGREIGKNTFLPEVNGQPSWSPDGSKIVFWSNRNRHREIFVMNADGSDLHSLSTTAHDDWNPVWMKYSDPPRQPAFFGLK